MTTKPHSKIVSTQINIRKVKFLILIENPSTQRSIASKLGVSCGTVSKIICKDLKLKHMFKPKVNLLLIKYIAERKTNYRKFYKKHLAAKKWNFVVTLDET